MSPIQSASDFGEWLDTAPREWGEVVAVRAALRVLPLSERARQESGNDLTIWREVFRAGFTLWSLQQYRSSIEELKFADSARQTLDAAAAHLGNNEAVFALQSAAETVYSTDYDVSAIATVEHAARAARDRSKDIWKSVTADIDWLNQKSSGAEADRATQLAKQKLWLNDVQSDKFRVNLPNWVRGHWSSIKASREISNAGFDIWFRWYEGRLLGIGSGGFDPSLRVDAAQKIDLRVALQNKEAWDKPPVALNNEIKKWIEQARALPTFNLIVTGARGAWDHGTATIPRSRFLEASDPKLVDEYGSLGTTQIEAICSIPALFAYESTIAEPARAGHITRLVPRATFLDLSYIADPRFLPIDPRILSDVYERLGIGQTEQQRTHWEIKQGDLYAALEAEKLNVPLSADSLQQPNEPAPGPGPQYTNRDGKLSEEPSSPAETEARQQSGLHRRLQADVSIFLQSVQRIANRYPELVGATKEYSELLKTAPSKVDVTGVWAVGGALTSFAQSYREQNISKTLAEPLEPGLDALLQNIVRQHGAFIMGFSEGRSLVERADAFAVDVSRLREMEKPGNVLLEELTGNARLVDARTQAIHRPVRDSVVEFGWATSRAGYSAYLIVRNSVRAMIRLTVGSDPNLGVILGFVTGTAALSGDPNLDFIRVAVPVLREHGTQLLAFFNHSPEMRAYVDWALRVIQLDKPYDD